MLINRLPHEVIMPFDDRRFPELIRELYKLVAELEAMFPGRPFTPDGHMVGSLAECFAEYYFGLKLYTCSYPGQAAHAVLAELLAQEGAPRYLFTNPRTGKAVQDIKKGFRAACLATGLDDFIFHDLRHTFATRLKEAGVDAVTRRDLLGHASTVMTDAYTHSAAETKQAAVDSISPSANLSPLQFPAKAEQPPSAAAVSA